MFQGLIRINRFQSVEEVRGSKEVKEKSLILRTALSDCVTGPKFLLF